MFYVDVPEPAARALAQDLEAHAARGRAQRRLIEQLRTQPVGGVVLTVVSDQDHAVLAWWASARKGAPWHEQVAGALAVAVHGS